MRLHKVMPEYEGRVRVRPFPLEVGGSGPAPRDILEQEWWLAAIQEPAADFAPYEGDDWPATTLPAFEAAWCAFRQGEEVSRNYDLQVRRAFFAEGRNIGRPQVLREIAEEAGLDVRHFEQAFKSGEAAWRPRVSCSRRRCGTDLEWHPGRRVDAPGPQRKHDQRVEDDGEEKKI